MKSIVPDEETCLVLVDNIPDVIIYLNERLRMEYATPSVKNMLGYSQKEIINVPYRELFTEHSWGMVRERINRRFENIRNGKKDDSSATLELELVESGGEIKRVDLGFKPVYSGNRFKGMVILVHDTSDRMRYQKELESKDEMLRIINKIMRHDIRNHLAISYGYLGLALEIDNRCQTHIRKAVNEIKKTIEVTKRMTELENLFLSGRDSDRVDIARVAKKAAEEKKISVQIKGDCRVKADEALYSVFDNLITNANIHGNATEISIISETEDDRCRITVSDNGKGIPPEIEDQIFEEGISYGRNKGTGLGLYIVRKTIKRYGGSISVEDNEPKGTRFVIHLPLWK